MSRVFIDHGADVGHNQTLAHRVAMRLYEACVPDHVEFPYSARAYAEQRAFIAQARVAIQAINDEAKRHPGVMLSTSEGQPSGEAVSTNPEHNQ